MEKTGWQIAAGVLAIACVGLSLGVVANKSALAESKRLLQEARNEKQPKSETLTVIQREPCPYHVLPFEDPSTECRGGVLLRRTADGWESVMTNGRATACMP